MDNSILCGSCLDLAGLIPPQSVDLVFTSPPYAEQRAEKYPSITEAEYPEWTVKWMESLRPAIKSSGSVAIVIRPHLRQGQISDYVLRTRLAVREAGWVECDEFAWVKPCSPPLGSVKRPRRAWESVLWFGKSGNAYCDPKANGTESTRVGFEGKKQMGEKHKRSGKPAQPGIARCRDYVEVGTSATDHSENNTHPAQFPVDLARWFVRLLAPPDGLVLDPFLGSGSTALACVQEGRRWLGFEICEEYYQISRTRIAQILQ